MKYISLLCLFCYRIFIRLRSKCFSVLISGAFASFGKRTVLMCPLRLFGEARIAIGEGVFIGANSWLQVLDVEKSSAVAISIGNRTSIAGACVISAARRVVLEEEVMLARNVYIADHMHRYSNPDLPILAQGVEKIEPVVIKRGAWLCQNVVVCPGVTVGRGSVVGANSVVNTDVPDFSVAAGSPVRVLKTITPRTFPTQEAK